SGKGPFHPPRNRTAVSAENTTMPAYSASRKSAKRSPVYSVSGPKMISESAYGMSNGGRASSARAAVTNTTNAGACQASHQGRHDRAQGHQPEHRPVGGGRDDVLLLRELHAVGDELRPAVEGAGVHRPEARLHVRHHLVLGLPDEEREQEEGREHRGEPDHD